MAVINPIDSSTTVSAATAGMTVDLRRHDTVRLSLLGVPVRFKVRAAGTAGDTGAIRVIDENGIVRLTVVVNGAKGWYWVNGYLPATRAKYDLQLSGNTLGSLTLYSAHCWEYDWTQDGITGDLAKSIGTITGAATGTVSDNIGTLSSSIGTIGDTADGTVNDNRGTLSSSIGAVGASATGGVEVRGDLSQSIGTITDSATGTVTAAVAYQAVGAVASNTAGNGATPAYPTHIANDYAILVVVQGRTDDNTDPGAATLTTANGFVAITGGHKGSTYTDGFITKRACHITTFECRCTSSSMAAPVVAGIANNVILAYIITFRFATTSGSAVDVVSSSANNANDANVIIAGADPSVANTVVLAAVGSTLTGATPSVGSWTNADLTSFTERADSAANAIITSSATGGRTLDTAYGNSTATLSATGAWAGVTLALKS